MVVQREKILKLRGTGLFMDVGTEEGRDRDAYGSCPTSESFLSSTTTTEITASNSYHIENDFNKRC